MSWLYIAEKPSTMQAVKAAYEKSNKPLGNITFVALAGHVCNLREPKDYKQWNEKWANLPLPMIPDDFKVKPVKTDIIKKVKDFVSSGACDGIIVGTDSDVEGNGIYALLEKYLHLEKKKTLRFYETDLTDKGIMNSFQKLTDFHTNQRDVGMTQAYWVRAQFDWLIGFNMTVLYTVKTGMLMKVGRVKAPTLKLVYDNCNAIERFVKKDSYLPTIHTESPELAATLIGEDGKDKTFEKQSDADAFIRNLGNTAVVKSTDKTVKKKPPQQLYKLSDIQVEAGQKYGYSPEMTLNTLQSLYENHKIMSYPRTDGRYVSSERARDFPILLRAVAGIPELKDVVASIANKDIVAAASNKRYVNDTEVQKSSHDALIPTGKIPDFARLSTAEKNICTMVYKRFLAIFLPDLVEEKRKYILHVDGNTFVCKGSTIVDKGYTQIFDTKIKEVQIPDVIKGQSLSIRKKELHKVEAQPPKRLTQALLIDAMENIQKYMDDKELKSIMKEAKGIGQPSSRAGIIKDLLNTGYMKEDHKTKGLYITGTGKAYIEYLKDSTITNPALSAQWELHMKHIREGSEDYESVRAQILEYVKETVTSTGDQKFERKVDMEANTVNIPCPRCGLPLRQMAWGYGCCGYPDCNFSIPRIAKKMLSEDEVKDLLNKSRTQVLDGFISKTGRKFKAALIMDGEQIRFSFDEAWEKTDLICPVCGSPVVKNDFEYRCSEHDNGCRFAVRKIAGKMLAENQVGLLLKNGKLGPISGFAKKDGTRFNATLTLTEIIENGEIVDYKVEFAKPEGLADEMEDIYATCPVCGKSIVKSPYAWECPNKCSSVPYKLCDREMDPDEAQTLFTAGETPILRGFTSKKHATFSAGLRMGDDGKITFYFPQKYTRKN